MKKHRSAFILEKLEPRLLLSADLALLPVDGSFLPADQDVVLVAPAQLSGDSEQVAETAEQVQHEVIFIDARVEDYQQLLDDIQAQKEEGRQFETVLLDSNTDGITQISNYLSSQQNISAVHIISHGSNGEVVLGDSPLNLSTLEGYADSIEGWQQALTDQADLLFYGCNLASGVEGQNLVSSLALLTNADVAASDDVTGQAVLGGDWELEYATGQIETSIAFSSDAQQSWDQLLDGTVADNFTNIAYDGSDGTQLWSNDWQEINESDGAGAGNMQVYDRLSWGRGLYLWKDHVGAWREVDLSDAVAATLSFDVATSGLDAGDSVTLEISTDGGGTWDVIDTFDSNGGLQAASYDISAYIDSDTQIKFESTTFGDNDEFFVDNLQVNFINGLTSTSEFLVNTPDIGNPQETSAESRGSEQAVAMDSSGHYVVVWSSLNQDGSGWGVFAQRYNDAGNPLGGEFQITQTASDNQLWARVAMDGTGNFTVTWTSENQDGTASSVYARQFNAAGNPLGAEFRVNTENSGAQLNSSIAMDDSGNFIIAWQGDGPSGDSDGIYFRRFNADGSARDLTDQSANSVNRGVETNAVASMNDAGEFAIAWEVTGGIYLRPFNDDGSALWSESKINGFTTSSVPAIAMGNDGKVTVAWRSENFIHDGIWLQIYDSADESLLPGAIQVDQNSVEDSTNPSISMDIAGNCIVTYEGSGDGDGLGAYGRKYDSSGSALGDEFLINETISGIQHMVSTAMLNINNFVAVWSGEGATDDSGVYARQFNTNTISLSATQDTYLNDNEQTFNYGSSTSIVVDQAGGDLGDGRVLLQFDLSSIPAGATITSASLELNATSNTGAFDNNVYKITESWVEGSGDGAADVADWDERMSGVFWSDLGALTDMAPIVATLNTSSIGLHTWDITSLAQDWLAAPAANFGLMLASPDTGTEVITYDSREGPTPPKLVITYSVAPNSAPAASDDNYSTNEDTAFTSTLGVDDLLQNDSDPDGDTLTVNTTPVADVSNGALVLNADGTFTYTPDADWNGSDAFTYELSDGNGGTDTATVTISVDPVNDAPTATNMGVTVLYVEDTPLDLTDITISDVDSPNVTASLTLSDISAGTLSVATSGSVTSTFVGGVWTASGAIADVNMLLSGVTFTPALNYDSVFSISTSVDDGVAAPITGTITVNSTPVNDAGSFTGATGATIDEDTNTGGTLTFSDAADGATTPNYHIEAGDEASNGSAAIDSASGAWTYTPAANFNGSDSFTVSVTDDDGYVETQVINITVTAVTDLSAADDSFSTNEDTALIDSVAANDSTTSGGTLSYVLDTDVTNGVLTLNNDGSFTYTPNADFNGGEGFSYTVTDANSGESSTQNVAITVNPVNDLPIISAISDQTIDEDSSTGALGFSVSDVETAAGSLTVTASSSDTALIPNGNLTLVDLGGGTWTIEAAPATNMNGGPVTITVTVDDGTATTDETFNVTVNPVDDTATFGGNLSGSGAEDGGDITGTLTASDTADGMTTPNFTVSSVAANGTASINNVTGDWTYAPNSNFNSSDSFTVQVTDDDGNTATQVISITVNAVTDLSATDGSFSTNEDTALVDSVAANDSTTSGGILSYAVNTDVSNGVLSLNTDGSFTYTPTGNFNGSDSFSYTVTDADSGESSTQNVAITVNPVDDTTTFGGDLSGSGAEDGGDITGTLTATDTADGMTTPNFTVSSAASNGTASINNVTGDWSYAPNSNFNGSDSFTVQVTDDDGNNATQAISITVNPVNDVPTVANLIADQTATEDSPFTFQFAANTFNDVDGDTLTYTSDASGWISFNAATRTFSGTPLNGDVGTTTITVTADDGQGGTISDIFDIVVSNTNDAPTITSSANLAATEDSLYSYTFTATDVDAGDTLTLSAPTLPGWLNFNTTTGVLSGTPTNGSVGDHPVVLRVNDGTVDVDQSFTITVINVNDAPTAISLDNLNIDELNAGAIVGNLNTTDVDAGDTHTYTVDDVRFEIVADQLKLQAGQSLDHGVEPTVDVTITSTDAGGLNTSQLFTLTVNATNLEPTVVNDNLSAVEDNTLTITSLTDLLDNDSDPDGDTISMAAFTQPTHGTLVDHGDGTLTYTPDHNFSHTDSFDYTISDGHGSTANGTAFIYVAPVGDTPQVADAVVLAGSQSAPIMISRNAGDGAEVTHFRISSIGGGTLYLADGVTQVNNGDYISVAQGQAGLRFTPADDAVEGSFQVESSADGVTVAGQSGRATSTIRVTALPLAATPEVELTPQIAAGVEEVVEGETAADEVVESVATAIEAPVETQLPVKEVISADFETGHNRSRNSLSNPILSFIQNGAAANENDESLDASQRSTQQPLNVLLETTPIETLKNVWGSLDIGTLSVRDYDRVRNSFDALQQEVKQEDRIETAVVSSAIATTMGLSAGYVVWMLKGGSLLASVLSSMPAWHLADPLSILSGMQRDDDDDDESLESILKDSESDEDEDETEQDKEH